MNVHTIHDLLRESHLSFNVDVPENIQKEFAQSQKEDKIKPFRNFKAPKPLKGTVKGEAYSVDATVDVVNKQWKDWTSIGIDVSRKMDGVRCIVHKVKDKVELWTEEGSEFSHKTPTLVSQLNKLKGNFIVEGELEWYHDGHMNRSLTAGMIHQKKVSEFEGELFLSLYDMMWNGTDLHNEPWTVRKKQLFELKETPNVKLVKQHTAKSEKELRKAIDKVSAEDGSEGGYLKLLSGTYPLDGRNEFAVKYKQVMVFSLEVLKRDETKGGNFVYTMATRKGNRIIYMGKTFPTKLSAKKGEVLDISAVNINVHYDKERKLVWFALWSPKVLRKRDKKPDTVETLLRAVEHTSGQKIEEKAPKKVREAIGLDVTKDKIVFLGTRGGTKKSKQHNNQTSLLIVHDGKRYVFNLGEDWKDTWKQLKPDYIIITSRKKKTIFGLKGVELDKMGISAFSTKRVSNNMRQGFPFRRKILTELEWSNIAGLKVMPVPVVHSLTETDGYLIQLGDKRIAYFPDILHISGADRILKGVDLFIGSGERILKDSITKLGGKSVGNLSMRGQLSMLKKIGIKNAVFTNLSNESIELGNLKLLQVLDKHRGDIKVGIANDNDKVSFQKSKLLIEAIEEFDDKKYSDANQYLIHPDEKKEWPFVLMLHRRGKSIHADLRLQVSGDFLAGWTLFVPKGLPERLADVSFTEATKIMNKEIMPLIKERMINPLKKMNATTKSPQPKIWLKFQGRVEKGTIGATKETTGDFWIIEKGVVELGAQRSDYHEYWFWGTKGLMNGKYVLRLLENKKEWKKTDEGLFTWMFFKSKSSPYVLRERSFDKKYHPPLGISAVPRKYRKKIPTMLKYWKSKTQAEAIKIRKELSDKLKQQIKSFIDDKNTIRFELKHQTYRTKGKKPIRAGPSREQWHLLLIDGTEVRLFTSEQNMEDSVTGLFQPKLANAMLKQKDGEIKAGTKLNQTKETGSWIKTIDKGKVIILSDAIGFKRFIFKGKLLKGVKTMVKSGNTWTFKSPAVPKTRK